MRKNCYLYFIGIVAALSLSTCVRYNSEVEPQITTKPTRQVLTIEDARVFFEDFRRDFGSTMGYTRTTNVEFTEDPLEKIDWTAARYSVLLGEEVVEVPFVDVTWAIIPTPGEALPNPEDDGDQLLPGDDPGDPVTPGSQETDGDPGGSEGGGPVAGNTDSAETGDPGSTAPEGPGDDEAQSDRVAPNTAMKLIAGVDEWGDIYYRVVYVTAEYAYLETRDLAPEELSLEHIGDSFDGQLWVHAIEGELMEGYTYSGGQILSTMRDPQSPGPMTRSGCYSISYDVYNYGVNSSEGLPDYHWYVYVRTIFVVVCDGDGGGGSGQGDTNPITGSGGGGPTTPTPPPPPTKDSTSVDTPLSDKLLKTDSLTREQKEKLEAVLDSLVRDCLGKGLYNAIVGSFKGLRFNVLYNTSANSSYFHYESNTITLKRLESPSLIQELWHTYQIFNEFSAGSSGADFEAAAINMEMEAWYAQYLYSSRQDYYVEGNFYHDGFEHSALGMSVRDLRDYIDAKGRLKEGLGDMELNSILLATVVEAFKNHPGYKHKPYDYGREGMSNFRVLQALAAGCNQIQ